MTRCSAWWNPIQQNTGSHKQNDVYHIVLCGIITSNDLKTYQWTNFSFQNQSKCYAFLCTWDFSVKLCQANNWTYQDDRIGFVSNIFFWCLIPHVYAPECCPSQHFFILSSGLVGLAQHLLFDFCTNITLTMPESHVIVMIPYVLASLLCFQHKWTDFVPNIFFWILNKIYD